MKSKINDMEKAIEILERELAQRKLANTINHLRKDEVEEEIKSLEKALELIKECDDEETECDTDDSGVDPYSKSYGMDSYDVTRQPYRNNY